MHIAGPAIFGRFKAGEHQVDVLAHEPWNDTGLYLQPGKYSFAAEGQWHDASICSGPDGTTGMARFNPLTERLRLLGSALGPIETFARRVTGNQAYNLLLSRREEDLPWMCLVGVIANENAPKPSQRIVIRRASRQSDDRPACAWQCPSGCATPALPGYSRFHPIVQLAEWFVHESHQQAGWHDAPARWEGLHHPMPRQ